MEPHVRDTSEDYEDLVGFKASENIKVDLIEFFGEAKDNMPEIHTRAVDPNFPEKWQSLYVNFRSFDDCAKFMKIVDEAPVPNLKSFVYNKDKDNGVLNFLGD